MVIAVRPDLVRALVVSPPLPGIGERVLNPDAQREFWYQSFHQLSLAEQLVDGQPDAVRAYLRHFWSHWSGPRFALAGEHLDHLVAVYSPPGAFVASIGWYRAGPARSPGRWVSELRIRRTGWPRPRLSSGLSTIRSSRASGRTGWTSSSPTCGCGISTASATSCHWRRRSISRPRLVCFLG